MKQITEDYVSYETAKLLKEKGFDKEPTRYYRIKDEIIVSSRFIKDTEGLRKAKDFEQKYTQAPSLSLALKWLREVHNLHIDVFIGSDESYDADGVMADEWHFWTYYITNTSGDMIYDAYNKVDVIEYQTHEEAVEAALLWVLKNLI